MARARPISELDAQAPTARNARLILRQRLDEMYAYAPFIADPAHIQELHDLRIATKRVRYTLELFEEFLPAGSKEVVEELTKLQDELGALHDSEVMLALLRQLLQQEPWPGEHAASDPDGPPPGEQVALLSPELAHAVVQPAHATALSQKERSGLLGFLHRQEQRRAQAYALFRQHWEELEQRHFHESIVKMLNT
ncbi:MAG TPA: CHAD domain-containing protein [Ktedonobacteraceae bacterium]